MVKRGGRANGSPRRTRGSGGIPGNLKPLANQGERVRFNGFWLNESPRDRAVAEWLDTTPGAAAIIKDLIYRYLTPNQELGRAAPAAGDGRHPVDGPALGEAGGILGGFDD